MRFLPLSLLASLTTSFAFPQGNTFSGPSTVSSGSDQDTTLQWTLQPHYHNDKSNVIGYSISAEIETDWNSGLKKQVFALNLDTGSPKTWVHSSLIPEDERHEGQVYYPPKMVQARFAAGDKCRQEPYEHPSGDAWVDVFEATITVSGRRMKDFEIGAAFEITDKFQEYPSSVIGDGTFGLSPTGATAALDKLGLGEDRRQFLFDAGHSMLSLEELDSADPPFSWLTGAVGWLDDIDYWMIPGDLSSVGRTFFDSGGTYIYLSDDQVDAYFASYPEGSYDDDDGKGNDMIACDETDSLPRLKIMLGKDDPMKPRTDFGLSAEQLRSNYAYTTRSGKRFCYTRLSRMPLPQQEDGHGAILGLSWLQNYQVAFDPKRERVGVRSAGISEEGTDDDVD